MKRFTLSGNVTIYQFNYFGDHIVMSDVHLVWVSLQHLYHSKHTLQLTVETTNDRQVKHLQFFPPTSKMRTKSADNMALIAKNCVALLTDSTVATAL